VYRLKHVHCDGLQGFNGVRVTPIDPGQVTIAEGVHIPGEKWRLDNVRDLMQNPEYRRVSCSGESYRTATFATKSSTAEAARRHHTAYGMALEGMRLLRKKTCDVAMFELYCRAWHEHSSVIWNEVLDNRRRKHRFLRFRATQRALEAIAEEIAPIKGGKHLYGQRIVIFEDGLWQAKRGAAASPIKKIVRVLCPRAVTVITPAPYSTITCPGCGHRNVEGTDYRTRLCTTGRGCQLHIEGEECSFDRDIGGRTNSGLRGVYVIAGVWSADRSWIPVGYEQ